MRNFHLPLPDETYTRLRAEAERTQVPATTLAREAVDWWLRQQARKARQDAISAYAAEMAGTPTLLSSREVAKLIAARTRYFVVPPPGGGAELPVTCDGGESAGDRVRLTRSELDALIDEAVRKDRSRR